jgi:hypothetical protein
MKTSQRLLLVASLGILAVAMAGYCLDFQTHEAYRVGDRLFEPQLVNPPLVPSPVLIKLAEVTIEPSEPGISNEAGAAGFSDEEIAAGNAALALKLKAAGFSDNDINDYLYGRMPRVTISGLYPRGSMTPNEAAIGGLLVPFLLLVAAGYVALGTSRAGGRRSGAAPASAVVERLPLGVASSSMASRAPADASEIIAKLVPVILVIFPVIFALDMPSVMLLSRLRFPRWLFALLVLRAFANARGPRQ